MMDRLALSLTATLALTLGAAAVAETTPARLAPGPLPVRDHFLLGAGFLAFEPASASLLEPGSWQVDAVWSLANTWAISPQIDLALRDRERQPVTLDQLDELARLSSDGGSVFVDGELSRLLVVLRRGFGRAVELELRAPLVSFGGGHLDGAIESFHEAISRSVDGRTGAPRDQFLVALHTRQGRYVADRAPSSGFGDVVLGAKFRVHGDTISSLGVALEALVKLPTATAEPLATSGSTDFGAQILLGRTLRKWSFHGSAGVVALGSSRELGLDSQWLAAGTAAAERAIGARTSLLLQLAVSESPFGELATSRIDSPAIQATLGLKWALGARSTLFAALTDNFQNFTNTADVDLHLGISHSFH